MAKPYKPLIPYALDASGGIHFPNERDLKGSGLLCPDCNQPVFAKPGRVRRSHFAHKPESHTICGFHGESAEHIAAKHLVKAVIEEAKRGRRPMPLVQIKHQNGEAFVVPLPKFDSAHVERAVRCNENKRRRPDVVLLDSDQCEVLAIEIYYSHAVDLSKEADLQEIDCPIIEFEAQEILRQVEIQGELVWKARWNSKFSLADLGGDPVAADPPAPSFGEFMQHLGREIAKDVSYWWKQLPIQGKIGVGAFALLALFSGKDE